jgi:hypothetical protein
VHAANEVTRHGRDTLALMCRELAARGVTLLEADTDGVYFAVPDAWSEEDERRVVAEVGALLPPLVQLEAEGRYAAMLSHEPKNYALQDTTARSCCGESPSAPAAPSRSARRSCAAHSNGSSRVTWEGVREVYHATLDALRRRELPSFDVSSRVRLTKSPGAYAGTRDTRRELAYEALLAGGRPSWRVGERVRVYRTEGGGAAVAPAPEEGTASAGRRDYDVEHYARGPPNQFAARLARALSAEDFAALSRTRTSSRSSRPPPPPCAPSPDERRSHTEPRRTEREERKELTP